MRTKSNPVAGLLVGVVLAWGGVTAINYASIKLNFERTVRFETSLTHSLPWLLLIVALSAVVGLVLSIRPITAGALVGAGAVMALVGAGVFILHPREAFKLSKLFVIPGTNPAGYIVWDGSVLFVGVILLVLGVARWVTDARSAPKALQGGQGYYQPGQQQGQWQPGQQLYPGQPGQWQPGQQQPGQPQPYPRSQGYPPQDGPQQR